MKTSSRKSSAARQAELRRLVARQAALTAPDLAPLLRADLFDGVALLLSGKEADSARHTAFLIRESERSQLQLFEFLNPKPSTQTK